MKIIIAPDSFKGSLTAKEAADAIADGVNSALPEALIDIIPLADGGEGTLDSLVSSTKGQFKDVSALDPLGRKINAPYGILGDRETAVIEMSLASGITLIKKDELNPLFTSTYGTGQLIKQALDDGYRKFIICIGGSATNDGGTGMAQALGIKFLTSNHLEITGEMCGDLLRDVTFIQSSKIHQSIKESEFLVASDVSNTLLGVQGCAHIYAPQKGATPKIVEQLERNMSSFINIAEQFYNKSIRNVPGSGAAGGLGAGLMLFLNAQIKPGVDIVLNACNFSNRIKNADLIITGEGKIDDQTIHGKTISGVTRFGNEQNIPVIAFAGSVTITNTKNKLGISKYYSISSDDISIEKSIANASTLLKNKVKTVFQKNYTNN
jgi:glycerate kinase